MSFEANIEKHLSAVASAVDDVTGTENATVKTQKHGNQLQKIVNVCDIIQSPVTR